jgi:hypothetical protein
MPMVGFMLEIDIPDITQEEIEELCCYRHSLELYQVRG